MKSPLLAKATHTAGDAAVDGLLAGAGAGVAMLVYMLAAGVLGGAGWTEVLAQFDPSPQPAAALGVVTHLAVSGVYGAGFGLAWRLVGQRWPNLKGWLVGAAYGALLWGVAVLVVRAQPAGGWLQGLPWHHLAAAHVVYGLLLGAWVQRSRHA